VHVKDLTHAPVPVALHELHQAHGIGAENVLRADLAKDGDVWLQIDSGAVPVWYKGLNHLELVHPEDDERLPLVATLDFGDPKTQLLAWRPGRRIAVRVEGQRGFEVLKGLRPKKLRATFDAFARVHRALKSRHDFVVPSVRMIEESSAIGLAGLELSPIRVSSENAPAFRAVGAALARFQSAVPTQGLQLRGFEAELGVLGDLAQRHIQSLGQLPEGWDLQRRRLFAHEYFDRHRPVAAHRDLHGGQLLAEGDRVALLDFDLLASASPLLDLGNLSAHFQLRALQAGQAPSELGSAACERALLAGYDLDQNGNVANEYLSYKATTHLRLSLVYSMRPRWSHLALPLLQLAAATLDEIQFA